MSGCIEFAIDRDGIAVITIDMKDRSMNVISAAMNAEFAAAVERVASDAAIKGAIITSGKSNFVAGADLREMEVLAARGLTLGAADLLKVSSEFSRLLRRMEKCDKPIVAAITGTALGGGFEICLACHYRVAADNPAAAIGLPEVKVGLLPGAGGTQRVPRLIGIKAALPLLLEGRSLTPAEALKAGLVNEVVGADQLLEAAKRWIISGGSAVQPWDRDNFSMPGPVGQKSNESSAFFMATTSTLQAKSFRIYPAPQAILRCVYEGTQVPLDAGLTIESRQFALLLRDPVAGSTVRTMFVNKQAADKLEARPKAIPPSKSKSIAVLGAGMMGQGITYVAARAGIDVILLDQSRDFAERGKGYSRQLVDKAVAAGKLSKADGDALLDRVKTTDSYTDLAGVDLVIEAVFEHRDIKAQVTAKAEALIPRSAVFASNTSTLPITGLAETFGRPDQFIGLHFFSPVDKMQLVEVILGKKTSDETLARALDLVKQIRKTPIVVRDSRGFYTSRCFGMFPREGMTMLAEGVKPALIENAARMAGMPVGPLAVADEVSIELIYKVREQEKQDIGDAYKLDPADPVIDQFVKKLGRLGRKGGAGFYDYPQGDKKRLWTGLAGIYPESARQPSLDEVKTRILYRQAVEAVRCFQEGVIAKPADGDLGAILGWGFAPQTGGPFSMINTIGIPAFIRECDRLAQAYGERFSTPDVLRRMADEGRAFYPLAA